MTCATQPVLQPKEIKRLALPTYATLHQLKVLIPLAIFQSRAPRMAVGRLQAALAAATNEVTVAAANLNFDFTLVKYEAPKEYQPLGNILSTRRKDNAELGSSHILARKLGALFEDVCPSTPRLLEAYGKRATEIAKASQKTSDPYIGTLFGDFTGIDGTSLWAAATSSNTALYVHLLASLLARMWTAPEAIAIWVELVEERRKDIARRMEEGEPVKFGLAAAAGQEITRSQLAAWDTSARAWLRTADDVFRRNQKQLELILKNINLPVVGESKVFQGVIKAWVTAVETMDKLIAGMPQAVQDGASLVGLSAWHIYPDMAVFSPELAEIKMDDPLVAPGGLLSIGLANTPRTSGENNGVYWSLSLAQLRFYGRPVKVERAMDTGSRITFAQLHLVIFGVLLAEWQIDTSEGQCVADTLIALVKYVIDRRHGSDDDKRLLKLVRDSALAFLERENGDKEMKTKLIQLGRRRAQGFIHGVKVDSKRDVQPELFNLLDPSWFMTAFKDKVGQILFLRHIASSLVHDETPLDTFIIRCTPHSVRTQTLDPNAGQDRRPETTGAVESSLHGVSEECREYEKVTVSGGADTEGSSLYDSFEIFREDDNITIFGGTDTKEGSLYDFFEMFNEDDEVTGPEKDDASSMPETEHLSNTNCETESSEVDIDLEDSTSSESGFDDGSQSEDAIESEMGVKDAIKPGMGLKDDMDSERGDEEGDPFLKYCTYATALPIPLVPQSADPATTYYRWPPANELGTRLPDGELNLSNGNEKFRSWEGCVQILGTGECDALTYDPIFGDPMSAALFVRRLETEQFSDLRLKTTHLLWCLEHNLLNPVSILQQLCFPGNWRNDKIYRSLRVLTEVATVYDDMSDSTIDVGVLDRPLLERRWVDGIFSGVQGQKPRSRLFSIISYFESGIHDVDPSQLKDVIAMSSADSLFVCLPVSNGRPTCGSVLR